MKVNCTLLSNGQRLGKAQLSCKKQQKPVVLRMFHEQVTVAVALEICAYFKTRVGGWLFCVEAFGFLIS